MNISYVLDASAIFRFTDKEPGFDRVRDMLHQAAKGDIKLAISAVNWGEIMGALYKRIGALDAAKMQVSSLASLPITIVAVDKDLAEAAALLKCDFKITYADALAAALAREQDSTLVTADYDFKAISAGTIKIEFLPAK